MTEASIKELVQLLKDQNYTEIRKWVRNNLDTDVNYLYNQFYDVSSDICSPRTAPVLVMNLAKYQYQNAFAANPEINFMAFLVQIMIECEFV